MAHLFEGKQTKLKIEVPFQDGQGKPEGNQAPNGGPSNRDLRPGIGLSCPVGTKSPSGFGASVPTNPQDSSIQCVDSQNILRVWWYELGLKLIILGELFKHYIDICYCT